jgi:hypothetical protein
LQVVNTVYALGKMGAEWERLPSNFKSALTRELDRVAPVMGAAGLANSIW